MGLLQKATINKNQKSFWKTVKIQLFYQEKKCFSHHNVYDSIGACTTFLNTHLKNKHNTPVFWVGTV